MSQARRVVLILACVALGLGAAASAAPRVSAADPVATCPDRSAGTFQALTDMADQGGPLAEAWPSMATNERGLTCLGATPFQFVAFHGETDGHGGLARSVIEPHWLDPLLGMQWLAPNDDQVDGFSIDPLMLVAVDPEALGAFKASLQHWVVVTATFDHPAARTCVFHAAPEEGPFDPAEIIDVCRARLVVTGVSQLAAAPTASPPSTPSPKPATPSPTPVRAVATPISTPSAAPSATPSASPTPSAEATGSSQGGPRSAQPSLVPASAAAGSGGSVPLVVVSILVLVAVLGGVAAVRIRRTSPRRADPRSEDD